MRTTEVHQYIEIRTPNIWYRFTEQRPFPYALQEYGTPEKRQPVPSLVSVDVAPTEISSGIGSRSVSSLGFRGALSFTLSDFTTPQGVSFWALWLAQNPNYAGLEVWLHTLRTGEPPRSRVYLLDEIDGPDYNGTVTIQAGDPLQRIADNQALYPPPLGASLGVALNDDGTTPIVIGGVTYEAIYVIGETDQIGAKYGGLGAVRYYRIGDEIISCLDVLPVSNGMLLMTPTRGALGTTKSAKEAGVSVEHVASFEGVQLADAVYKLIFQSAMSLDPYLPLGAWRDNTPTDALVTTYISEPTPADQLVGDMVQAFNCVAYWDDESKTVQLRTLADSLAELPLWTDDANLIAGSVQLARKEREKTNVFAVAYAPFNWTKTKAYPDYSRVEVAAFGLGRQQTVLNQWTGNPLDAADLLDTLAAQYRAAPFVLTCQVDHKDSGLQIGQQVRVKTRLLLDSQGQQREIVFRVLSRAESVTGSVWSYKLQGTQEVARKAVYMADDAPDYDGQNFNAAYYADDSGTMPDGSAGYTYS